MKTLAIVAFLALAAASRTAALTPAEAVKHISWYGQNSLRIELEGKVIWIDPVGISLKEKADVILLTHRHDDHFSVPDVKQLSGPGTVILAAFEAEGVTRVRPGDVRKLGNLTVRAVPAYNIKKANLHPKENGWCGFVLTGEGVRIYDAGDTERIPEMKDISCDIALLPLGQTYTMNSVEDAVQSALDVKAKIAIPVHFGQYEGKQADAEEFVEKLRGKRLQAFILPKR